MPPRGHKAAWALSSAVLNFVPDGGSRDVQQLSASLAKENESEKGFLSSEDRG